MFEFLITNLFVLLHKQCFFPRIYTICSKKITSQAQKNLSIYWHTFESLIKQGPDSRSLFPNLPDHVTANGELSIAASRMICSHSVSGDLYGVAPDPVQLIF